MASPEEKLLEALDDDDCRTDADEVTLQEESDSVLSFLGAGAKFSKPVVMESYYLHLLAWTLKFYFLFRRWKVIRVTGCSEGDFPGYSKVNTAPGIHYDCLVSGCMLLERDDVRLVARIRRQYHGSSVLVVHGNADSKTEIARFALEIQEIVNSQKMYKGKKLRFDGKITFIESTPKGWDDLALAPELKEEILDNTVNFLRRRKQLSRYGIPRKRGIILAGAPGTGKTLISRVLVNHSTGITCLASDPALLSSEGYINALYQIASDLKPSIVFLEDIDMIGQQRLESHYSRGDALNGLLDIMDGVEDCHDVVTIATTNCPEVLDRALSQRPSRFDRIITLSLPDNALRRAIVSNLSRKIPVDDCVQDHIVMRTEGYTPAQIQEVMYSMVIRQKDIRKGHCIFTTEQVDDTLRRISHKNGSSLGFKP